MKHEIYSVLDSGSIPSAMFLFMAGEFCTLLHLHMKQEISHAKQYLQAIPKEHCPCFDLPQSLKGGTTKNTTGTIYTSQMIRQPPMTHDRTISTTLFIQQYLLCLHLIYSHSVRIL